VLDLAAYAVESVELQREHNLPADTVGTKILGIRQVVEDCIRQEVEDYDYSKH